MALNLFYNKYTAAEFELLVDLYDLCRVYFCVFMVYFFYLDRIKLLVIRIL